MIFEVTHKVEQDVKPVIAAAIAEEFLEWADKQGWFLGWKPAMRQEEPKAPDGGEMGFRDLARLWAKERETKES